MLKRRIDFTTEEEYNKYLYNHQQYIDNLCYNPDPLTQFINRRNYYEYSKDV